MKEKAEKIEAGDQRSEVRKQESSEGEIRNGKKKSRIANVGLRIGKNKMQEKNTKFGMRKKRGQRTEIRGQKEMSRPEKVDSFYCHISRNIQ